MILERLKNRASARGVVPGFLRPIDTAAISRELDLARKCAQDGRDNTPPSDSGTLGAVEQQIIQKIESEWAWQGGELLNQLRAYAERLVEHSIASEFEKLRLRGNDALARLRTAHHRAEADLGPLRESFQALREDLKRFRERNRLVRAVHDPARRWTAFGLLFVMVAIESLLNGFFFAKGSDFGYIGGVGTAIGISLVNVIFAFILGWGPARWINYRGVFRRSFGFILTVAGVCLLVGFHAFAVHLRDATAHLAKTSPLFTDEEAMRLAYETLTQSPLQVADLSSAYLFGLGVLFALLALWKGYTFDDPYPGYGAHHRRFAQARDDYSNMHAVLFDSLHDIKEGTVNAIAAGIDIIPRLPQMAASIRTQRATVMEQFRAYETSVETAGNQLLAEYRQCNQKARTEPAPPHFAVKWRLPYRFVDHAEVKKLLAEPDLPAVDAQTALYELRELSSALLKEYEELMRDYPHPTRME